MKITRVEINSLNLKTAITLLAQAEQQWIAYDLDGTLAEHKPDQDIFSIGKPLNRKDSAFNQLKKDLKAKKLCKILTARVSSIHSKKDIAKQVSLIQQWTKKHFGVKLEVTSEKDYLMTKLYDDKAKEVKQNEGGIR